MKKKIFIILIIITFSNCASNKTSISKQKKEFKTLIVEYDILVKPRKLHLKQKGILTNQSNVSKFRWAFGKEKFVKLEENGIVDGWVQDETGNVIFKQFKKNIMLHREILYTKPYAYKEKMPLMNWIIKNEKKIINSYECTKATLYFRGRNYEAWFTTKIPVQDGPWKFYGLPGLILEVYDLKKEYSFTVTSIQYPVKKEEIKFNALKKEIVDKDYFYRAYILEFEETKKRAMSRHEGDVKNFEMKMIKYNPQEIFNFEK